MADKIRIVIADDHPLFRAGVMQVAGKDDRLEIVGETDNGEDALRMIADLKPDVAVLDITMPRMSGLDVARRADASGLETSIILLTMLEDRKVFLEAIDAGVKGYVLKDGAVAELMRAIETVVDGRHYVSPTLAGSLIQKKSVRSQSTSTLLAGLTPTELRVLRLIGELKSNQEIAETLFISKRTVENHRVNMARKLGLSGSHSLLKFALQTQPEL